MYKSQTKQLYSKPVKFLKDKCFYLTAALLFSLIAQVASAQLPSPEEILNNSSAPLFARLSVTVPIEYNKVLAAYNDYCKNNPRQGKVEDEYNEEESFDYWRFYFKRWKNVMERQLSVDGKIINNNDSLHQQFINERQAYFKQQNVNSTNLTSAVLGWRLIGPTKTVDNTNRSLTNDIGNIYSVHFNKTVPTTGYCGTEGGYIFKTTDNGESWQQVGKGFIFSGMRAIATDPNNPDIVFVANRNLVKSTDGGITFTTLNTSIGSGGAWEIIVNPLKPTSILVASVSNGILQSYDGGVTFTQRVNGKATSIMYHPTDTNFVFSYVVQPNATATFPTGNYSSNVYKSTNGGFNFVKKNAGWITFNPALKYVHITGDLVQSPSNPNRLYTTVFANETDMVNSANSRGGDMATLTSTDMGETWTIQKGPWALPNLATFDDAAGSYTNAYFQPDYNNWITVNPKNENQILIGGLRCYKSTDNGITYTNVLGGGSTFSGHPDYQNFFLQNDTTWICNDGGILKSTDFVSSQPLVKTNGLHCTQFWGFGVGWNNEVVTGGVYHNGNKASIVSSYPQGEFIRAGGSEEPTGYVSPYDKLVQYSDLGVALILPENLPGTSISTSRFSQFPTESYGQDFSDIVYHPNNKNTVYLGNANSLFITKDNGVSFSQLFTFTNNVMDIFIPMGNSTDTIYLCTATDNKVWRSANGGISFTDITAGLPAGSKKITGNLMNGKDLFVLMAGTGNVYRTSNAGGTWIQIGGTGTIINGKNGKRLVVQASKTNPTCYYAANDGGVYYKNNSTGTNWTSLLDNLPAQMTVRNIKPFYGKNKFFLAMDGLGIWEHDFVGTPEVLANFAVDKREVFCSKDTIIFYDYSIVDESTASATRVWSFPGASFVGGTDKQKKVLYPTVGTYSATLTVTDITGGSNSFTLSNAVKFASDICKVDTIPGNAITTNTATTAIIPIGKVPINSDKFTISAWVKPAGKQRSFSQILATNTSSARFGIGFTYQGYNPNLNLVYTDSNNYVGYNQTTSITLDSAEWSYITLTYSPTGVTIYKNGMLPGWTKTPAVGTTFAAKNFSNSDFFINSDIHRQGGDFKGEIDEISFFDTVLSIKQIRENMHLTKVQNANHLVRYVQSNQYVPSLSLMYDAINGQSITVAQSNIVASNTPVASGNVFTIDNVNTLGNVYNFTGTGMSIKLPITGTLPNGTLVGFKLNYKPDTKPNVLDTLFPVKNYWIINNYGANQNFASLDYIKFSSLPQATYLRNGNTDFKLWKRPSYECESSWPALALDTSDNVVVAAGQTDITFSTNNKITSFSQLVLSTDKFSALAIKNITLKGKYNNGLICLEGLAEADANDIKGIVFQKSETTIFETIVSKNYPTFTSIDNTKFCDTNVIEGKTYYYRYGVKTINGNIKWSNVVKIAIPVNVLFKLYPNPVKDWATIEFVNKENAKTASVQILDASGRLVRLISPIYVNRGANKMLLSLHDLPLGVYSLIVYLNSVKTGTCIIEKIQ